MYTKKTSSYAYRERGVVGTRRRHDDELVRFRYGVIVDFDSDASTGAGDPSKVVELTTELGYQVLRFLHSIALQISL